MGRTNILVVVALTAPAALLGQTAESGAFVVTIGRDTVVVESFTRSADRIAGRYIARAPQTLIRDYEATLAPDGTVRRLGWTSRTPASGASPQRLTAEFRGDSAVVEITRGDSTRTVLLATPPGTLPFVGNSWVWLELAARRFRTADGAATSQPAVTPGNIETRTIGLERVGADSMAITVIEGLPYRARVDREGRVLGARWPGDWRVERVRRLDMERLTADFARRPLGTLSPADSVRVAVAGTEVAVRYARPAMRGRKIFGNVVPWNQVWRTGANEATLFTTTAELVVGDITIPAGEYTLWTLPNPTGWKLIINSNTGQWGTEYDAKYDFARIDMQSERLPRPVERFTIGIEPRGSGGTLRLEWETTRAWVELQTLSR